MDKNAANYPAKGGWRSFHHFGGDRDTGYLTVFQMIGVGCRLAVGNPSAARCIGVSCCQCRVLNDPHS